MSDTPQGPGWWQASDGKWYPPQAATPAAATATPAKKGGCLKWALILGGVGVVAIIGLVAALSVGANKVADELEAGVEAETAPVDPDRPDAQDEDQVAQMGGSVQLSGYTATVTAAVFQQSISQFESSGYIVADVTVVNRDEKAQPYNLFDWKIQTPNGQVLDPEFTSLEDALGSGDLVKGGTATGKVVFEVGGVKGDFFVIYKPDAFDAARGVWKVSVS